MEGLGVGEPPFCQCVALAANGLRGQLQGSSLKCLRCPQSHRAQAQFRARLSAPSPICFACPLPPPPTTPRTSPATAPQTSTRSSTARRTSRTPSHPPRTGVSPPPPTCSSTPIPNSLPPTARAQT
ncbi:hypothetical protein K466DRAFT_176641 [Polyporus arcularius HHB13444]|uniref:Uncharacterized protein n=1 Tax=Polyporus arcularius HHB13444 TaxID=1314778 RepID=A0A5C3PT63_9APHY|nr:hypothetical protein K466DRAFT_176641 [Polyporus arcularius HHB13444]